MTTESLMKKLAALHAKAQSAKEIGNEHEAAAFAAKVSELLSKHKLSMSDVEFAVYEKDEPVTEQYLAPETWGHESRNKRNAYIQKLASTIARHHSCRILIIQGSNAIWLVGKKSDREVAQYLLVTLANELERISWDAAKTCREETPWDYDRAWRRNWMLGAVQGVSDQLLAQRRKDRAAATTYGGGNALVRLDMAENQVAKYMERKYTRSGPGLSGPSNGSAYNAGRTTGQNINIRKGVGGTAGQKQITS